MSQAATTSKHPKGLYVLFATEMWERFNFYGMRAILIFFATKALLMEDVLAFNVYGTYIGMIYLTPLIGGYIADKYWGNNRSIMVGGILMIVGELILFLCGTIYESYGTLSTILLFSGLGFMIAGNGFFKPNISSMVGQLYPKGDLRKDSAYTIFYIGINVGGALGPIICGLVGDTGDPADFRWAFLVGAIAMTISLIVQRNFAAKYVVAPDGTKLGGTPGPHMQSEEEKALGLKPMKTPPAFLLKPAFIMFAAIAFAFAMIVVTYADAKIFSFLPYALGGGAILIIGYILLDKGLTWIERQRIIVIFAVCFFVIFFWAAYEQTGASLNVFGDRNTDRHILGWEMPASLFQSFNSIFIVIFGLPFAWIWVKLGKKQPSTPAKMGLGLVFLGLGYLWIAQGVKNVAPSTQVSMIWLTLMYVLHTWGELCLSPIGLSLTNKLSPLKFASLLMAVWFLANAAGNKLAGVLSTLYPDNGKTTEFLGYHMNNLYDFFMLFVYMCIAAGVLLIIISKGLKKMMHGVQ